MLIEEIESFLEVHYKSPKIDFFFKNIEYLFTKSNYSAEVLILILEIFFFSRGILYINPRNRIIFRGTL